MKVLLYNWVAFDDEKSRGGGVTVYLSNLINKLVEGNYDIEITFLSSGSYYDIYDESIRIESVKNIYGEKCRSYAIINSPVFSPAYLSFPQLDMVLYDEQLRDVFLQFLEKEGPFDIVHFHNLEGLSMKVLETKNHYPNTKFIYTLHNYYAFCPQVNLWRNETKSCTKKCTDEECLKCMKWHVPFEKLRRKMAMTYTLSKRNSDDLRKAYSICGKKLDEFYRAEEFGSFSEEMKMELQKILPEYRKQFVRYINTYMDEVLGVSKRVCDIAEDMGIKKELLETSYIGTKVAETSMGKSNNDEYDDGIAIIYMGYKRNDKGYYFLMEVLNSLERDVANKIAVTIAAKSLPEYPDVQVDTEKFRKYISYDGYKREEIDSLLQKQHLGIIPVLWEDNLPQVAIEMVAHGVPILTSDMGGASEIANNDKFCFHAADVAQCAEKIKDFVKHPDTLQEYWTNFRGLKTMDEHIKELLFIYQKE